MFVFCEGKVAEWLIATDCKSVEFFLRRFESYLSHYIKNNNINVYNIIIYFIDFYSIFV